MEDYREDTEDSDCDEEFETQTKQNLEDFDRRVQAYQTYMSEPTKENKSFIDLKLEIDQQLIENQLSMRQINSIFFKLCSFYKQDFACVLQPQMLIDFFTAK